jgi:glucan 1,4-alpha-glucosidase
MNQANLISRSLVLAGFLVPPAAPATELHQEPPAGQVVSSPGSKVTLSFRLTSAGAPVYQLAFAGRPVIRESRLGIELKDRRGLTDGFTLEKVETLEKDETWEPVWGEVRRVRNHYREGAFTLRQASEGEPRVVLRFRVFDDGLAFRYEFPEQKALSYFIVSDEKTELNMTGDHKAFWIPGDYDSNEYLYSTTRLSEIDATPAALGGGIAVQVRIAPNAVQTPLMMKTADGLYVNLHEAGLVDYPAMNLAVDRQTFGMTTHLVPDAVGNKAYLRAPARTPWRTVVVGDRAGDILASKLILNVNEPSKIADPSWIKPQKFVGVWWEMHVEKATWSYADVDSVSLTGTDWKSLKPNGRHGANTANVKRYVDFAARHGFPGVLVEGWNVGWEDWFGRWKEEVFDFVTPYPDFDVDGLHRYAAAKGVKLIMHHETSASVTNYERRMDEAYRFMKANGYDAVKTGYVGKIIPRGEHHDGQWMVNHYVRVAEATARYGIMLDAHEPVRPTGLHRTYPNWMACEAARGNEFNAWSTGNPVDHETILPFTRLMGGPMDYTPGIFQIKRDYYAPGRKEQVHTTLAKQLALYVTMYSPLQMAADLPENYERFPDALKFIEDVAVDWDDTRILEAEPGDYLTIARKAKDKDEWYVGAITDENARTAAIPLGALPAGRPYVATVYADAPDAHWEKNPMAYRIQSYRVDSRTVLKVPLAPGGGAAISVKPGTPEELKAVRPYAAR